MAAFSTIAGLQGTTFIPSPLALAAAPTASTAAAHLILQPHELSQLVAAPSFLAANKVVIHASTLTTQDHAPVYALRNAAEVAILYSQNDKEAAEQATIAAALATKTGKAVVHFGEFDTATVIQAATASAASSNGTATNGATNGANGHSASPLASAFAGASLTPFSLSGSASPEVLVVSLGAPALDKLPATWAHLRLTALRPLDLAALVPQGTKTVVVLEKTYNVATKWKPLFLDVLAVVAEWDEDVNVLSGTLGVKATPAKILSGIQAAIKASTNPFTVGTIPKATPVLASSAPAIPKLEGSYSRLLAELFGESLAFANAPTTLLPPSSSTSTLSATSPEYALGRVLASELKKTELRKLASAALSKAGADEKKALEAWLADDRSAKAAAAAFAVLAAQSVASAEELEDARPKSNWIVGSQAWSFDLGSSGLHHALSTGADVNLLLIDTTPYALPGSDEARAQPRRKDAGLYAMNYGNAYVASVAIYGDFAQTLRAFEEANKFKGPSVILAYLPRGEDDSVSALEVLKQTKKAIEVGSWPLYRWNPAEQTPEKQFELDSEKIKADLAEFLDRQNHLTELARRLPVFDENLASGGGVGPKLLAAQKSKAKVAFDALEGALEGPPLLVLFASDGGAAEKLAKRLTNRAKTRGVGARILAMDDFPVSDLALEENVVLITSVAGQGEFPQNGREFWKAVQSASLAVDLSNTRVGVFAMGDSHYWPRKEDAHYYNKAGKDLHRRIVGDLKAPELVELGLGDDQDGDGPQTAYKPWEANLWKALGVDNIEGELEPEPEPITNEHIKIASNYLRGTIVEGLNDTTTGALSESDGQLTKFHGIYQQDDRDIRDERKAEGLEPAYSFMVRMRLPAGVCKPEQWLAVDEISDRRGNHTFKLTTRQTFQFHGIVKRNLKPAMQEINKMALDTVAACGDVNRTVMCSANPSLGALHATVFAFADELSEGLKPQTSAYAEIWLDKKQITGEAVRDVEPLYGEYYLPRKFKIAIAVPPNNDTDVFCHDLGYIAIVNEHNELLGYNVTIGGGMGVTHSMKTTYPRLANVVGFITPDKGLETAKAVLTTQRDNGNRANRKNARVKYTVDRMGIDAFAAEVEKRQGYKFEPAREYLFTKNVDEFGWQTGHDGKKHFTVFIENGRVQDEPGRQYKTGMAEIARVHKGVFRLTANQHLIISDIAPEDQPQIEALLKKYGLDEIDMSGLRLSSAACVAFPTCGLAMAESERYLPVLIDHVEKILEEEGLRNDSITMRMTGCPNGCARPWAAEVAFVGKAPGSYLMMLGGGYYGQRLNKIYRETVTEAEILEILRPMFKAYALERLDGERFGDFVIRKGYISATTEGKHFYEGMAPGMAAEEA